MGNQSLDIQELTSQSGVPRRTIYFYVQQGILPPPQGAGLAASYSEEHLLRLRLIPVLRREGLRLDEIRERFGSLNVEEMRRLLDNEPEIKRVQLAQTAVPPSAVFPGAPFRHTSPAGWVRTAYTHYALPAGIFLAVPEQLNATDRQRLQMLLHAAQQIFSGVAYASLDARDPDSSPGEGHASTSDDPSTSV